MSAFHVWEFLLVYTMVYFHVLLWHLKELSHQWYLVLSQVWQSKCLYKIKFHLMVGPIKWRVTDILFEALQERHWLKARQLLRYVHLLFVYYKCRVPIRSIVAEVFHLADWHCHPGNHAAKGVKSNAFKHRHLSSNVWNQFWSDNHQVKSFVLVFIQRIYSSVGALNSNSTVWFCIKHLSLYVQFNSFCFIGMNVRWAVHPKPLFTTEYKSCR